MILKRKLHKKSLKKKKQQNKRKKTMRLKFRLYNNNNFVKLS